MECERCHTTIAAGEAREHLGQTLCEDCYMEVLSPVRACDPWAVHSAKTFEKHAGSAGTLTPIQAEILAVLKRTGGIEPSALRQQLSCQLSPDDLKRQFASLRHMEKARAEKQGDRIIWRLW